MWAARPSLFPFWPACLSAVDLLLPHSAFHIPHLIDLPRLLCYDSVVTNQYLPKLACLTVFAIAMAYLESAIVVYLRAIYYPQGFAFPLASISTRTFLTELGREAATLLMLFAVARLAFSGGWARFAAFAYLFGTWDIFYYLWLKVFLDWPQSLLDWDVLFLIPIVWIGPVLAPVLVSLLLIAGSLRAFQILGAGRTIRLDRWDWIAASAGAALILGTFMQDAACLLSEGGVPAVLAFVPTTYNWPVFLLGLALMAATTIRIDHHSRA